MTRRATLVIDRRRIDLSNQDKVLFPDVGLTKGDLVNYYRRIADIALPYFRDRPLSMERYPDGIAEEGFFQKNLPDHFPDWIDRVELSKHGGCITYVVANQASALVYLANQGCITPHLSLARSDKPFHPDRLIFDLDPSDEDFGKIRQAARWLKVLLDELGMASFVQTTGSRGLHIVVPLDRTADFDESRDFAFALAKHLARRHGDMLTVEQRKDKRDSRVFLDYLRNAYGQTSVAPYGVRAIEGAPVATPIAWREVARSDLQPRKYTMANIFRRLARMENPWSDLERRACSLAAARRRFSRIRKSE